MVILNSPFGIFLLAFAIIFLVIGLFSFCIAIVEDVEFLLIAVICFVACYLLIGLGNMTGTEREQVLAFEKRYGINIEDSGLQDNETIEFHKNNKICTARVYDPKTDDKVEFFIIKGSLKCSEGINIIESLEEEKEIKEHD